MQAHHWIATGAALGAVGISLGAFGAHSLPLALASLGYGEAEIANRLDIFETGARYQMYSAFGLAIIGLAKPPARGAVWSTAGWMLLAGGLWFSGLLYTLAFVGEGWRWLGAIVPLGGGAMVGGWGTMALAALIERKNRPPEA